MMPWGFWWNIATVIVVAEAIALLLAGCATVVPSP